MERVVCPATGKVCFDSKNEARWARSKMHSRLRVYTCPYCRYYHMTNHEKR